MAERRNSGATHSFRLSPRAASIMDNNPAIRPNSKYHNKSRWASDAIVWFFDSAVLTRERDPETGDYTGKYVKGSHGAPTPIDLVLKVAELEQLVQDIKDAGDITSEETNRAPPGWVSRVIVGILGRFRI
jgi:hypothetical protein